MELGDIEYKMQIEFPERVKNLKHQMGDLTREAKNSYEYWQKEETKAKEAQQVQPNCPAAQ